MKLDFNKALKTIKGEDTPQKLNDILADVLSTETKGNAIKLFDIAKAVAATGEVNLDRADRDLVKGIIEGSERIVVLVKAQLLECLAAGQEEA